jgi:parallel beta-helix repeat protein
VIRRNTFDGVAVSRGADGMLIAGNRVSRNGEFGIFVNSSTTRILRNTANANGRSGIYVFDQYGTFFPYWLEGIVADRSGDYGIAYDHCIPDGAFGVDAGDNAAKHDGMAAQCLNIACAFNRGLAQP